MRKRIGLEWEHVDRVQDAVRLIEDTSDAMHEVSRFGLYVHRKDDLHVGEAYLRLYGVLNAAYLLRSGIQTLFHFFMSHAEGARMLRIREHSLYELRNRLAAHTMDFGKQKNIHQSIAQIDMYRLDGRRSFVSSDKGYQEIDIAALVENFQSVSAAVLLEVTDYTTIKVITPRSPNYEWVQERLSFVRNELAELDLDPSAL